MERPHQVAEANGRLAQLAVRALLRDRGVPRLGIRENRADDGLHVAAHAAPVVREFRRDARDVCGARVAGDEELDQLLADVGADVRMVEDVVERRREVGLRVLRADPMTTLRAE